MFQLAEPWARSQVVVEHLVASMEQQRVGLRSSARLPPEASMDSGPVPGGTCSVCELRPSWQLEGQTLTCAGCLLDFHLSCSQHIETRLGSRCAAEACLHRVCCPHKSMPTLPLCMQDSGLFCCVCRFTFSESPFLIDLHTKCL